MKNFNFKYIFVVLLFSTALTKAQDKVWVGPSAGSWGVAAHWSPAGVPGSANDVIIPPNTWVNIDVTAFMKNLSVLEGAIVDKTTDLAMTMSGGNFAFTSTFNFEAGNVNNGNVNGGLFFDGEVNVIGPERKRFAGNVTINNVINIGTNVFDFNLRSNTMLIAPGATMNTEDGSIAIAAFTATLRNEGTITKLTGSGTFTIDTVFENDGGTINIDTGSINISGTSTLTDGNYNINSNGFLLLDTNIHFINGILTGQLDGPFIFNSQFRVSENAENFLEFSGLAGVEWRGGALSAQGQTGNTLINKGILNITDTGTSQIQLSGGVILRNEGEISFNEGADFDICSTCIFDNTIMGTIAIEDNVDIFGSTFTNTGLVQKVAGMGSAIILNLDNDGNLNCESGTLVISQNLTTGTSGSYGGSGNLQFPAGFILEGELSPGSSPGTLTIIGDLLTTTAATYDIEIDGPIASTEYDQINITNNAVLEGTINIALGFEAEVNDEFVIITANAITNCNLPSQVISNFNGNNYTFNVICNPNNVTLQLIEINLGIDENTLIDANLYPNPTSGNFKIDFGKMQSEVSVSILNILGQVITNERFVNTNTVDLTIDGSSGMYFINVSSSDGNQNTFKIIKK